MDGVQPDMEVVFFAVSFSQGNEQFDYRVYEVVIVTWPDDLKLFLLDGVVGYALDVAGVNGDIINVADAGTFEVSGLFHRIEGEWHAKCPPCECTLSYKDRLILLLYHT